MNYLLMVIFRIAEFSVLTVYTVSLSEFAENKLNLYPLYEVLGVILLLRKLEKILLYKFLKKLQSRITINNCLVL